MTFIAQAPEGCHMWLPEMFQFEVIKQTWGEKVWKKGRWTLDFEWWRVDGPFGFSGFKSNLSSPCGQKREWAIVSIFSAFRHVSFRCDFWFVWKKRTAKNVSERMRARVIGPMDHLFICSYMYYIYVYIYMFHFCSYIYLFPYDMFLPLLKVSGPLVNFKTVVTQRVITI